MRVALVKGDCAPGTCGVGDYTDKLAEALRSLGVCVDVPQGARWGIADVPKAIKRIESVQPDVIHFQYPTMGFGHKLGPQLFAMLRRSIVTIHEASQSHILRKLSLLPFAVRSRRMIFTSAFEREFALKWIPWIADFSSVIPIGSNIKNIDPTRERDTSEIVYFGLIMPRKGLEDLITLAFLIRDSGIPL